MKGQWLTTSDKLIESEIYTRADLARAFKISDATLNNGVFKPAGTRSIWLFITRDKTADRTQYVDELDGDFLRWQGQTKGRTDALVIEHQTHDQELLVFYRHAKNQFKGGGFRYEGSFQYVSHVPGPPTHFLLRRTGAPTLETVAAPAEAFDPSGIEDGRALIMRSVRQRQGQSVFRASLIKAYDSRCAVSDCDILALLEAAHISPYLGPATNHVTNGLLLRADIHTLYDCGLMSISETGVVQIDRRLRDTEYARFEGKTINFPVDPALRPSIAALTARSTANAGIT